MTRKKRVLAPWARVGVAMLLLGLAGCAVDPSARGAARISPAASVALPIATRVAVRVDPTMPATQTIEFRGASWQYADAELMQGSAMTVFKQVFEEVGMPPAMTAPAVTLQVNGSSSLNPLLNEYHANAIVTVFPLADLYAQPIASFAGTGRVSQPNFDLDGIAAAYEGAFRQIAEMLLADPHLVAILRGY